MKIKNFQGPKKFAKQISGTQEIQGISQCTKNPEDFSVCLL